MAGGGYHAELERLIARARADHEALLERVSADLAASLPVDATGVTQSIDVLAAAVGLDEVIAAERDRLNRSNPAVLHGRVFGRAERLPEETVVAAFAEAARVRETLLDRLAGAIGGDEMREAVAGVLTEHPPPEPGAAAQDGVARLRATYEAQERAVLLCAARLDELG